MTSIKKGISGSHILKRMQKAKYLIDKGNQYNVKGLNKIFKDPSKIAALIGMKIIEKSEDGVYEWKLKQNLNAISASEIYEKMKQFKNNKNVKLSSREKTAAPEVPEETKPLNVEEVNVVLGKMEKLFKINMMLIDRISLMEKSLKGLAARIALMEGTILDSNINKGE